MLPDWVSNPGPLTYESGALPIALPGPAYLHTDLNKIYTVELRRLQKTWSVSQYPKVYRIYLAIRRGFHLSRMTTNNLISSM